MRFETDAKEFVALCALALPLALVLPYAFVASHFRGLVWVWETGNAPFWSMLCLLSLLAVASAALLWCLQDLGITLFRVGLGLATVQTAYLAMSERRHALLLLVFALFALGVFLGEKMKKVMRLPFYHSRRSWWEGYPKGIPGLAVELSAENGDTTTGRLSNFGEKGCFVFLGTAPISFAPQYMRLLAQDRTLLEAEVEATLQTKDGFGWGLRFSRSTMDGDWSKDLQDYLGHLRRSGYEVG
jgi:hypothetical protein